MKTDDVYEKIKSFLPDNNKMTLCDLHHRCSDHHNRCDRIQKAFMIDFDAIMTAWCTTHHICSKSSVDGFFNTENCIWFVEIKGAKDFVDNQIKSCNSDKENLDIIDEQIRKYYESLKSKYVDSLYICEQIIGGSCFLKGLKIKYILVTDIDFQSDSLLAFAHQLNYLSEFSSKNWEKVYVESLGKTFQEATKSLDNVSTQYIYCAEFDSIISS